MLTEIFVDYQLVQNIGNLLATSLNPVTQKQGTIPSQLIDSIYKSI